MAIAASIQQKDKPWYGAGVIPGFKGQEPDFLDDSDQPKEINMHQEHHAHNANHQIAPPQSNHQPE